MLKKPKLPRKWRYVATTCDGLRSRYRRRELQHMLFTRRKAEIEIFCASKPGHTSQTRLAHQLDHDGEMVSDTSRHSPLLVRYLVNKITRTLQDVD